MTVRRELCTRPDVLHGGALMAFADTLGALGTLANLTEGSGTATIESKTNFISSAPVGARIVGEATPLHRGSRTMVWQTRITNAEGKLVAMVTQTQLTLPKTGQIPPVRQCNTVCFSITRIAAIARISQPAPQERRYLVQNCHTAPILPRRTLVAVDGCPSDANLACLHVRKEFQRGIIHDDGSFCGDRGLAQFWVYPVSGRLIPTAAGSCSSRPLRPIS